VTTPEGRVFIVGGGLNYPLEEKEFVRIVVDDAASRIKEKGGAAFPEIENPTSHYNFRDVKVFAFTPAGKLLISPVLNDSLTEFGLIDCADEMDHEPFKKALAALEHNRDAIWEVFLAKNRYQRMLVKLFGGHGALKARSHPLESASLTKARIFREGITPHA
jgi:hypothetical protein